MLIILLPEVPSPYIFEDLNFSLNQGEILGLLGPNGVGKSTIFNIIIGLLKPNYGSVFIEGKNVTQDPIFYRTKNYKIGYVPQHGGYFHDLTLRENLKAISEIVIEDKELIAMKGNVDSFFNHIHKIIKN